MRRLALLGTWHVHAIHHLQDVAAHPDAGMAVVWDDDPVRGRAFAKRHGLAFEPSLDVVVGRADIDAVIVDTPTVQHGAVIGAALAAGKPVFTEKLLALDPAEAQGLAAQSRAAGLPLRVSLQRLVEPEVQTALQIVRSGRLGRLTASRIRYAHGAAFGSDFVPPAFFDPSLAGGGVLVDLAAHPIYLGLLFHDAAPTRVAATARSVAGLGIEDNVAMILDYPDGALSVGEASFVASHFGHAIELTGTEASLAIGPGDPRVMLLTGSDWQAQPMQPPAPSMFTRFMEEVGGIAVADGNLDMAVRVTEIAHAARIAAESGAAVAIPLS